MNLRDAAFGGGLLAALSCNQAPPVPDNPIPFGAPDFGTTTTQSVSPPPISGGTLLLSRDGKTAVAADPDRDLVSFVDIAGVSLRAQTSLSPRDEPGRLVEDNGGLVHVALRGSGELATFSLATGGLVSRRPACVQPRGVAYDANMDQIIVACATGELVTFPAASGAASQTLVIEPGLRDVVVDGDSIFVSKLRTAEILQMTRSGAIVQRLSLPSEGEGLTRMTAALAWRMRPASNHRLLVSYQVDATQQVRTTPGGYGASGFGPGATGSIVQGRVAVVSSQDLSTIYITGNNAVLPVDLVLLPAQDSTAETNVFVSAGNWKSPVSAHYGSLSLLGGALSPAPGAPSQQIDGQLIAAEALDAHTFLLQSREPARLYFVQTDATGQGAGDRVSQTVVLSDASREDTGHTIFHTDSSGGLACASCHGEGGDDAQTWNFDGVKARRTPSLLGTVKGTAPYHWDADFADLSALVHEVYTRRMGGVSLKSGQLSALQGWLEQLPAPKRPVVVDDSAKARGQALFSGKAGCSACHSGTSYTNNATVDVGTGGAFQVPPLVGVGARPPFLHGGCASTLVERFTKCGTPTHGAASTLQDAEVADLVAFLDSL